MGGTWGGFWIISFCNDMVDCFYNVAKAFNAILVRISLLAIIDFYLLIPFFNKFYVIYFTNTVYVTELMNSTIAKLESKCIIISASRNISMRIRIQYINFTKSILIFSRKSPFIVDLSSRLWHSRSWASFFTLSLTKAFTRSRHFSKNSRLYSDTHISLSLSLLA